MQIDPHANIKLQRYPCSAESDAALNVNTGIKAIHEPSGIFVICTARRNQSENANAAIDRLTRKLKARGVLCD